MCCTHEWNCFALSLKRAGELSEEEITVFPTPPTNLQISSLHPLLCLCRHTRACQALANWADACCRGAGAAGKGHQVSSTCAPWRSLAVLEPVSFPKKSRCDLNHTLRPQTTCLNQPIQGSSFSFSHFLFFSLSLFLAFSLSRFLAFSIARARTLSLPTPTPPHPLLLSYTNSVSLTPYPLALTLSSTLSLSQPILVHCRSGGRARAVLKNANVLA